VAQIKTKITDLLDSLTIPYRVLPHTEPVFTVEAAAAQRGVVKEEMVKSILLKDREGRYAMACVPGEARLDPQAVRAALGEPWKRFSFATAEEIRAVTGYVQGAVAPLCLPDGVPVVMDEAFASLKNCNISSGDPLAGLELAAADLIRVCGATLARITVRENAPSS
jgi:prolyl-tRNA editing enzyme YbaK/EbsC (Cys-tRNA(Pro) deacylase)